MDGSNLSLNNVVGVVCDHLGSDGEVCVMYFELTSVGTRCS